MSQSAPSELADVTTNELLAMLELMYIVASADGVFSPDERREFLGHAESLSGGEMDSAKLTLLTASWRKRDLSDIDTRIQEIATDLPDETSRRITYGLAQNLVDADGGTDESKVAVLRKVALAFGFKGEVPAEISRSARLSSRPQAR